MYQRRIDRNNPSFILLLVDQSFSMTDETSDGSGASLADGVAAAINGLLYELVLRCIKDGGTPRHYYDIGLLTYSSGTVVPGFGGKLESLPVASIVDIANNPLRVDQLTETVEMPDGTTTEQVARVPVWFEPSCEGNTPMCSAFEQAEKLVAAWIQHHPDSFPPIVLNISDGESTDGDPSLPVKRIHDMESSDGPPLVFNLHLSAHDAENALFPTTSAGLGDPFADLLFTMSSPLPPFMIETATAEGHPVEDGARAFSFNGSVGTLAAALRIGTATTQFTLDR